LSLSTLHILSLSRRVHILSEDTHSHTTQEPLLSLSRVQILNENDSLVFLSLPRVHILRHATQETLLSLSPLHILSPAQEWRSRTVAEHACSKMGRAAARRNATRRSSRASSGQVQMREQKNWGPNTRGLSDFFHILGVCRIFLTYRGFIGFSSKYRGFIGFFT